MDNETEERYVFFRFCTADFSECIHTVGLVNEYSCDSTKLALLKSAIVAYSRPFSGNKAKHRERGWRLDTKYVPEEYKDPHEKIVTYRNQLVAHSGIPIREPKLGKLGELYPIVLKSFSLYDFMDIKDPMLELANSIKNALQEDIYKYEEAHF